MHFNLMERKKTGQIKELISNLWLILLYTVQLLISDVYTNFKILGQVVPEKSLTKISIFITLKCEIEKGKIENKANINLSTMILFTVIHLVVIVYTKFEDSSGLRC